MIEVGDTIASQEIRIPHGLNANRVALLQLSYREALTDR